MEATLKKQAELLESVMTDNKKLQSEIESLKKQLAEKKETSVTPLSVSEADTTQTKTIKMVPPTRTIFDHIYSRKRLVDVDVPETDKKTISDLVAKGYTPIK